MLAKKDARMRRAKRARMKIRELGAPRLSVHRTPAHIYAQVIAADGSHVIASASSIDKTLREGLNEIKGKIEIAVKIGKEIANRAKMKGVAKVAFDRSGFKYHGRVKALADAAREAGLEF
jgi:large subunit ribosomal protein L18